MPRPTHGEEWPAVLDQIGPISYSDLHHPSRRITSMGHRQHLPKFPLVRKGGIRAWEVHMVA